MFTQAKGRMLNSEVSGSGWVFDHFISITLRAVTDTVVNSGLESNLVGGKIHNGFILQESIDVSTEDGNNHNDDDDDDVTNT